MQLYLVLLISVLLIAQADSSSLEVLNEQTNGKQNSIDNEQAAEVTSTEASNLVPTTTPISENPLVKDRTYGVIVDCGSSGTRVHIYHWNNELSYSELLHHVEPLRNPDNTPVTTKITSPLTSLETNPEKASIYFKPIIEFILHHIPELRHEFTGIYIMATAGMRLLDEPTQKRIMAETKKYIDENYPFPLVKTSVISGADEGMYQWISVNAKEGRFLTIDEKIRTLGIIEMGGASIQVTYRLKEGAKEIIMDKLPKLVHNSYLSQIRRPEMSRSKQIHGAMDIKSPLKSKTARGKKQRVYDLTNRGRQMFDNLKVRPIVKSSRKSTFNGSILNWRAKSADQSEKQHVESGETPEENSNGDNDDHDYVLHSTTFLGFGSNSARDLTIDLLIKEHSKRLTLTNWWNKFLASCFTGDIHDNEHDEPMMTIVDPCLPLEHEELVQRPSRMLKVRSQTIGFSVEEDELTFKIKLKGGSNYNKCKSLVEKMLITAKRERLNCKKKEPCTMDLLGEPFVPFEGAGSYISFVALSDFYYTTKTMLDLAGTYDHESMVERTRRVCNTRKSDLIYSYPDVYKNDKIKDRITSECFKAVWVDTFLVKGLKMPLRNALVETKGQIKNDDPEWTLGAVLDKSLAIEQASETVMENRKLTVPRYSHKNLKSKLASPASSVTTNRISDEVSASPSVSKETTGYNPAASLSRASSTASSARTYN